MCQCQAASWWQGSPQKKPYCAWTYMRMHSYPELRNLDDPKKDFLAKQYPSKQLFLGIPPLPHLFFYSRKEIFGWVAKHSQNKQASLLWHVELICFLPSSSLLWDLIARLKFQAPCGHTHTALWWGTLSCQEKKGRERVGRPRWSHPNKG